MIKKAVIAIGIVVLLVSSLLAGIGDTREQVIAHVIKNHGQYEIVNNPNAPQALCAAYPDGTYGVHVFNASGVTISCGASLLVRPTLDWFKANVRKMYPNTVWELLDDDGHLITSYTSIDKKYLCNLVWGGPWLVIFSSPEGSKYANVIGYALTKTVLTDADVHSTPTPGPVKKDGKLIYL